MKKSLLSAAVFLAAGLMSAPAFAGDGVASGAISFIDKLLIPLGITTFILLAGTVTLGKLMPKNRKVLFKWHKILAFTTLAVAATHGILVMIVEKSQ